MASKQTLPFGTGRIVVSTHASKSVFTELASTYPLKLLSPKVTLEGVAVAYILSYGGGLVGGDKVSLSVEVQDKAKLVLLSQGSTKVFKIRPGTRLASKGGDTTLTVQAMTYAVGPASTLVLLPDPVTCFRHASYNQIQKFDLDPTASLVLLDSITAGRQALGENWDFSRYYSMNQVRVEGRLVANDVLLLQDERGLSSGLHTRSLGDQLAPYSCYAMVVLYGPELEATIQDIAMQYDGLTVYQRKTAGDSIWSFSRVENEAAVVRVAGKETEMVRSLLKVVLRQLEHVVGPDIYRRAFS
ncbi:UreD-domain-containing protein [Coprinopsis marcescibilis]|uniref:UreD-domain-containing protein n=1 Tax=Coprinopsis marcescibilis TaxID=230819 RepID=A0A5C3LFV6_COPMA|nr:UreD-domain-containing protein [Coprinopsis marcescibilis]